MSTLGDAYLAIVPKLDDGAMSSAISSISTTLGNIGSAATSAFKTVSTAATAAAATVVSSALSEYSSYEQNLGGIQKIFGNMGQSLEQYAQTTGQTVDECSAKWQSLENAQTTMLDNANSAWQTAGISANDYMEQATSFGASLVSSLGGDTEKAAEYANTAIVDMSDNANTFGTSIESIQDAYQGFAKQNYTMLDNLKLGYGGTQSEMQRLIQDAAAVSDSVDADSMSFDNCVQAIHVMQEQMNVGGTTAREAATTIEGSVNSMKAAWENWLSGLGSGADMSQLTTNLAESVTTAMGNIIPRVAQIAGELVPAIIEGIQSAGPQLLSSMQDLAAQAIDGFTSGFSGLDPAIATLSASMLAIGSGAIADLLTSVPVLGEAFGGLAGPISALGSPLGVAAVALTAFLGVTGQLDPIVETVKGGFADLADSCGLMVESFAPAGESIAAMASTLGELANGVLAGVFEVLSSFAATAADVLAPTITDALLPAFNEFLAILEPLIEPLTTIGTLIGETIVTALNVAAEAVTAGLTVATSIIDALTPLISMLVDQFAPVWEQVLATVNLALPQIQTVIEGALSAIEAVWNTVWPGIQTVFQGVWDALSPIVSAALSLIQSVITTVSAAIQGNWSGVWSGIQSILSSAWSLMQSVVSGAINAVMSIISGVLQTIQSVWSAAWDALGSVLSSAWSAIQSAVSAGIDGVLSFFGSLGSNILSAIGDVGSLLYNAGTSIVSGLLNGIKSAISGVYDFVSGIAGTIASLKGPIPYDLKLLIPNGEAIMSGLQSGLESGFAPVEKLVGGMADSIADDMSVSPSVSLARSVTTDVSGGTSTNAGILSRLDAIAAKLDQGEVAVYVDGKRLAASIARPMNQQLGILAARGV
jgi:phage-related protein